MNLYHLSYNMFTYTKLDYVTGLLSPFFLWALQLECLFRCGVFQASNAPPPRHCVLGNGDDILKCYERRRRRNPAIPSGDTCTGAWGAFESEISGQGSYSANLVSSSGPALTSLSGLQCKYTTKYLKIVIVCI